MSKMITDRKPPLAKSPIRLRPRRSNSTTSIQTPPGESKKPFLWEEAGLLRPEYRSISCELQALAKMVHQELGNPSRLGGGGGSMAPSGGFERGRFYEEYSARRKERLNNKRRKSSSSSSSYNKLGGDRNGDTCFKTPASKIAGLGVTATNNKKKNSVPAAAYDYYYSSMEEEGLTLTTRITTTNKTTTKSNAPAPAPRYMLRSMSKENRKPPAPPNLVNSVVASGVRRTRPF